MSYVHFGKNPFLVIVTMEVPAADMKIPYAAPSRMHHEVYNYEKKAEILVKAFRKLSP
jgi:hypothetical protein